MSRPRTPAEKAKVTGADIHDPQRHRGRAKPKVAKVGSPYKRMTSEEIAYWNQYVDEFPWLAVSDRAQLRLLCELSAERDKDAAEFPFNKLNMVRQMLNSFGGSPSDRTKVYAPDSDDDSADPAAEFFN